MTAPEPTGGEHVIEERGRVYDRCRCGWYGSLGDTHVAASTGTSEDVEALARVLWDASRADEGTISAIGANHVAEAVLASDWLAAREAAARAEAWDEGYHAGLDHGRGGARLINADGSDPDYNPYRIAREGQ